MATHRGFHFGLSAQNESRNGGILRVVFLFVFALSGSAWSQDRLLADPSPAAMGPAFDVNFGYIFHTQAIPGAGRVTLYGLDTGGHMDYSKRWAVAIDSNYIRTSNVDGIGRGGNVVNFLFGPVFYPVQERDTRLSVHALVGVGLANSTAASNAYSLDWATRFSHAIGAGIEQSVSRRFALRINADYVGKPEVGSSDVVGTVGVVYRLQPRIH